MKNLIVAVVFVAGVAVGFAACKAFAPKAAEPEAKAEKPVASEDADKLAKAQKRIAELEKQLAVAKAAKKSEKPKEEEVSEKEARKVVVNSGDDVLESLRKNLSEDDFKAATNALAAFKAKLANRARSKIDFLRAIDVSRMSDAERRNHETFIALAEKREAAMAKTKCGIPDPATLQEVVMIGMQLTPVAKKERSVLVREVARELGYAGDDVDVVHDAMLSIYDATTPEMLDAFVDAAKDGAASPGGVDVKVKTGVMTK
jgi:hypothetical protein